MGTDSEPQENGTQISSSRKAPSRKEKFATFIWNGAKGELLGRTGTSWAKIIIFYVIFYAALGSFAWVCYSMFSLTLEENRPKWIMDSSLIGRYPGLGFRPRPNQEKNPDSSLIWYRKDDDVDTAFWSDQLVNHIETLENATEGGYLQTCNPENGNRASEGVSCRVDVNELNEACSKQNNFGYADGRPCILIKLNRIIGWKPEPFGLTSWGQYYDVQLKKDLAKFKIPKDLRDHINNGVNATGMTDKQRASFLDTVWISCTGENIADEENIGEVEYYPGPGIPAYYFPYENQKGYQIPFVFVQLMKPAPGVLINIECRAWARNIHYNKLTRHGSVHFEVMIDEDMLM